MTVAFPQTFVDIYTYEGNNFSLQNGQALSVRVSRDTINQENGTFNIVLAPGGPDGPNMIPSWADVITPMSLVVIGMRRGSNQNVTMVGVVRVIEELTSWPVNQSGTRVERAINISGMDFSYFFTMFTYNTLWFLASQGAGSSSVPSGGLPTILGPSLTQGNPATIAAAWLNDIMAGSNGVLSKSFVPFNGTRVFFPTAIASIFEMYDVLVPFSTTFFNEGMSWMAKFRQILPAPFYEVFVTTAPLFNPYSETVATPGFTQQGYGFYSVGLGPGTQSAPTFVARMTPIPVLVATLVDGTPQFESVDTTRWQLLTVNQLDAPGPITNSVVFDESGAHNFYTITPMVAFSLNGGSNSNIMATVFNFATAGDVVSMHRYGFRPASSETTWMSDPTGQIAQQAGEGVAADDLVDGTLVARLASYWHPTPLMAKAEVTTWLRPDILPGTIFRYNPFKNDVTWDFYIAGVEHEWTFGGASKTKLTLERGLPTSVYADQNLLYNILIGNATRSGSVYTIGIPYDDSDTLMPLNQANFQTFLSELAPVYSTPQAP